MTPMPLLPANTSKPIMPKTTYAFARLALADVSQLIVSKKSAYFPIGN